MLHNVFLGLGSNIGNGPKNLSKALQYINTEIGRIIITSKFITTEPWGYKSSKKYTNAVSLIKTNLIPMTLLDKTQEIEKRMGRLKKSKNGIYSDRIIDIDILYYDNIIFKNERLIIPHPLIKQRSFVTIPLKEIKYKMNLPIELDKLI